MNTTAGTGQLRTMQPFPLDTNVTTEVKNNTFETQKVSIIEIGSYGILVLKVEQVRIPIVISEVEQVRIPIVISEVEQVRIPIVISEVEQVSLVVIIEEEPNIQWDSNCDQ